MNEATQWLHSEETLCNDYAFHVHYQTKEEFDNHLLYLRKAADLGRRPTPFWLWAILIILLAAEAVGFSYLLAGTLAADMSERSRQIGTVAIVIVLCFVLLLATHNAGHELFKNMRIKSRRARWIEDQRPGKFPSQEIGLSENQSIDDDQPEYTQCVNRVGTDENWLWVWGVLLAILLIAGLQFSMRMYQSRVSRGADTAGAPSSLPQSDGPSFGTDPSAPPLPTSLTSSQKTADDKAHADINHDQDGENISGFIMLSVLFVITQALGIYSGYSYGYAGKESADAYTQTRGAKTYTDYIYYPQNTIRIAQSRLKSLQEKIQKRVTNKGIVTGKTFGEFLRQRDEQDLATWRSVRKLNGTAEPPKAASVSNGLDAAVQAAVAKVQGLASKEEKESYLDSLSDDMFGRVTAELKRQKEAASTRRASRSAQLGDLLE
jgi:hypothetical protein